MLDASDAFSTSNTVESKDAYRVVTALYRSREEMRITAETELIRVKASRGERFTHEDAVRIDEQAKAVYIVWPSQAGDAPIEVQKHIFEAHYEPQGAKYPGQYQLKEGMAPPVEMMSHVVDLGALPQMAAA
jgi:hypothetical protein